MTTSNKNVHGGEMAVNANRPERWKADIAASVDFYNEWFLNFAPLTYQESRKVAIHRVEAVFEQTANLVNIGPEPLREHPSMLPILRMMTAPPIARDRLVGLASVSPGLVRSMELDGRLPSRRREDVVDSELSKMGQIIMRLTDKDLFPWLEARIMPVETQLLRAATVVADRYCGNLSDPLIRNAQEKRQLIALQSWLEARGYSLIHPKGNSKLIDFEPGTFAFRYNVAVQQEGRTRSVNIPIDAVIMPMNRLRDTLPILVEAKSAGDFTNPNKRRKEEATKVKQFRDTYGAEVQFVLFLCGYFDSGYLGYEAAEGIDWLWEHRIDDLMEFGI